MSKSVSLSNNLISKEHKYVSATDLSSSETSQNTYYREKLHLRCLKGFWIRLCQDYANVSNVTGVEEFTWEYESYILNYLRMWVILRIFFIFPQELTCCNGHIITKITSTSFLTVWCCDNLIFPNVRLSYWLNFHGMGTTASDNII